MRDGGLEMGWRLESVSEAQRLSGGCVGGCASRQTRVCVPSRAVARRTSRAAATAADRQKDSRSQRAAGSGRSKNGDGSGRVRAREREEIDAASKRYAWRRGREGQQRLVRVGAWAWRG